MKKSMLTEVNEKRAGANSQSNVSKHRKQRSKVVFIWYRLGTLRGEHILSTLRSKSFLHSACSKMMTKHASGQGIQYHID